MWGREQLLNEICFYDACQCEPNVIGWDRAYRITLDWPVNFKFWMYKIYNISPYNLRGIIMEHFHEWCQENLKGQFYTVKDYYYFSEKSDYVKIALTFKQWDC